MGSRMNKRFTNALCFILSFRFKTNSLVTRLIFIPTESWTWTCLAFEDLVSGIKKSSISRYSCTLQIILVTYLELSGESSSRSSFLSSLWNICGSWKFWMPNSLIELGNKYFLLAVSNFLGLLTGNKLWVATLWSNFSSSVLNLFGKFLIFLSLYFYNHEGELTLLILNPTLCDLLPSTVFCYSVHPCP